MGELVKKILIIGFFLAVFQSANMMDKIPASFDKLAFQASGIDIQPDVVLEQGIELVGKMWEALDFSIDSLVMVFAGIISLVAFALMAAQLFIVLVKIQALMVGAYLMLAFGGWSRTLDMAFNPLKAIFAAGMELMFIKLFMGLTYTTIEQMTDNVGNDTTSALMIIIVSILLASVVTMINGMVSSLMAGTINANSTAGLGIAAGAVGGAAAGVAASAKHGTGVASAAKAARHAAANSGGSAMGHFARAMGNDMVDTIKGKNARNTTSAASRAADAMKSQSGSSGSNQSSGGDGEISKGSK